MTPRDTLRYVVESAGEAAEAGKATRPTAMARTPLRVVDHRASRASAGPTA
ncbi:hypothetical protein ABZ912_01765 [Nonomuraea angiospora]|uniref:hypothetical protein n=1 Tax=Nonomuraea angiospora TaxID=46172 RepID=UPI0033CCB43E